MVRLMIADKSTTVRRVGVRILSSLDFAVIEATSALDALHKCEAMMPQILIVDASMDGALELIANIRRLPQGQECQIYYCIVSADLKTLMTGKRAGADGFLLKPFDRKVLTSVFGNVALVA